MEKSIRIAQILGDKQEYYLGHSCKTIDKSLLYTPGPDVIEKVWMNSDRNLPTLNNMRRLLMQGRLANTGYVSILPVDQGVEQHQTFQLVLVFLLLGGVIEQVGHQSHTGPQHGHKPHQNQDRDQQAAMEQLRALYREKMSIWRSSWSRSRLLSFTGRSSLWEVLSGRAILRTKRATGSR